MTHPKYFQIPIGVVQQPENYKKKAQLHALFKRLRKTTQKEHLLYMNFADWHKKPERKRYVRSLSKRVTPSVANDSRFIAI